MKTSWSWIKNISVDKIPNHGHNVGIHPWETKIKYTRNQIINLSETLGSSPSLKRTSLSHFVLFLSYPGALSASSLFSKEKAPSPSNKTAKKKIPLLSAQQPPLLKTRVAFIFVLKVFTQGSLLLLSIPEIFSKVSTLANEWTWLMAQGADGVCGLFFRFTDIPLPLATSINIYIKKSLEISWLFKRFYGVLWLLSSHVHRHGCWHAGSRRNRRLGEQRGPHCRTGTSGHARMAAAAGEP